MNKLGILALSIIYISAVSAMEKPHAHTLAADPHKTKEFIEYINYVLCDDHKSGYTQWLDGDGNNFLHEAAAYGCYDNVQAILEHYSAKPIAAFINEKTKKGETSLDKARYYKHPGIEELLKKHGALYSVIK